VEMVGIWDEAAGGLVPEIRAWRRVWAASAAQFQEPQPLYTGISILESEISGVRRICLL